MTVDYVGAVIVLASTLNTSFKSPLLDLRNPIFSLSFSLRCLLIHVLVHICSNTVTELGFRFGFELGVSDG